MDNRNDTTRRDALARSLCARISDDRRTVDELRVLDVIVARISGGGFEQYGGMDLATDTRDFRKEAADEFADALWYMAAHVVAKTDERIERMQCDVHDAVEPALAELAETTECMTGTDCPSCGLDHLFDVGDAE
jgi:hypothetical protein